MTAEPFRVKEPGAAVCARGQIMEVVAAVVVMLSCHPNILPHPDAHMAKTAMYAPPAAGFVEAPLSELPSGFDAQLKAIGYAP